MSKLTLSVDQQVIARAKRYASERGVSISEMVETYLAAVADTDAERTHDTPILRKLRGILKHANESDYRRHLTRKYR